MFTLHALLLIQLLLVGNYQLGWNCHLFATLPRTCIVWHVLVHMAVVYKVAMPKKGTTTIKVEGKALRHIGKTTNLL